MKSNNPEQNNNQDKESHRPLRVSIMLGSLLLSLLLWSLTFPPIFVGLFLSTFVSTFSYEILGIVDPEDTLDIEFGSANKKISGKFVGGIVIFLVVWVGSSWALERHIRDTNADLAINLNLKNKDSKYIYLVLKNDSSADSKIGVGKMDFTTELNELKKTDLFNPVLVKIREDCKQSLGLCVLPDFFKIKIVGINKELPPKTASVCHGHGYWEEKILRISNKSLQKEKMNNNNSSQVTIAEIDWKCKPSDYSRPRLKVSKDLSSFYNPLQDNIYNAYNEE